MAHESKTEAPTPRRRQKARERAEVARSQDLTSVLCLLGVTAAFYFAGDSIIRASLSAMSKGLTTQPPVDLGIPEAIALFRHWLHRGLLIIAPLLEAAVIAALVANVAQTQFIFSFYPLQPKLEKISLSQGFQRLFSVRSLVRGLISALEVGVVLLVAGLVIRSSLSDIIAAMNSSILAMVMTTVHIAGQMVIKCLVVMVIIGAADYGYQFYEHEKRLRMSRHELREELRELEGDPLIQAQRRRQRRELLSGIIFSEMPEATAVVTNPTEVAVALRYDETMVAPRVIAKGRGELARRIVELARFYRVPVEQNPLLARSLFSSVPVGEYIPEALYQAVAEILAIIYRKREQARQRRRRRVV